MEYINLTITQLSDEAYRRSSLADRGVWLTLLGYCVQQENNGRIPGAKTWGDWDCLQVLGIPRAQLDGEHRLWKFEDDELVVDFYPLAKQREVQAKRRAGRRGGLSSGEARTEQEASTPASSAPSSASSTARTERNRKGKGKEGEGEGEGRADGQRPQSLAEVKSYAQEIGLSELEAEKFFDHFTANGWRQGGRTALRSWQAALRNWGRRAFGPRGLAGATQKSSSVGGGAAAFDPEKPHAHTGGLPVFEAETAGGAR